MFIHNFCRLQEGVDPIHPATTSCETNVTYMRYLTYMRFEGVPGLALLQIYFGCGWLGTRYQELLRNSATLLA